MPRLTKDIKKKIIKKAIDISPLTKEAEQLKEEEHRLYETIRVHMLGGRENASLIDAIEEDFIEKTKSIPASTLQNPFYKSHAVRVHMPSRGTVYIYGKASKPIPNSALKDFDSKLHKKIESLLNKKSDFTNKKESLYSSIESVLNSVSTTGQLLKAWPEAEELIPENMETKINLPAVQTDVLNRQIGLPTS